MALRVTISLRLLVVAAAFALGGCNLVISQTPVFAVADTAGAPGLRPGVWAAPEPGCDFKPADPVAQWPDCANPGLIDAKAIHPVPGKSQPAQVTVDSIPYLLAAGDPRVMQIEMSLALVQGQPPQRFFYFAAFKPVGFDHDGRVVTAEVWPIQCGPPPPKKTIDEKTQPEDLVTQHPLPGLTVNDQGVCTPADKAAVLHAAGPSRAWSDHIGTIKWIKDAP